MKLEKIFLWAVGVMVLVFGVAVGWEAGCRYQKNQSYHYTDRQSIDYRIDYSSHRLDRHEEAIDKLKAEIERLKEGK